MSKKQLKKLKQKQKQQQAGDQTKEEAEKPAAKEISDILFTETNIVGEFGETEEFNVQDLFNTPILSTGLNRILPPSALRMTPAELYQQIKDIALGRFGHKLPEQKKLQCLSTAN